MANIVEIKLSNGYSVFVGITSIVFCARDGQLTMPTITFCKMDFASVKNWLKFANLDINRDDFRSIYFDGGLSLAHLLNHGLVGGDTNG